MLAGTGHPTRPCLTLRASLVHTVTLPALLPTVAGVGLLGLVAYDAYATILHSRARGGPIAQNLNRRVWWLARQVAFRCSRPRRHQILNAIGPLLLPALVATFISFLMVGYALIYWPQMPGSFNVDEKARSPRWIEALYFSGITLTTLGYGDIAPRSTAMRLVALSECSAGFAFISLAVTYLLTVTNALERKRTVALSFYHQAERGADAAGFLSHHFRRGEFQGLETVFSTAARDLQSLLESHVEHPVIHYFHPVEVHKSLPRMLFLVLEIRSVMRCCLDREVYRDICDHPEAETLEETARYVLRQLGTFLQLRVDTADELPAETPETEFPRWFRRFDETMSRFASIGIRTQADVQAGRRQYVKNRLEWERQLGAFAAFAGYDWEEVTGDRDLQQAEDHPSEPEP